MENLNSHKVGAVWIILGMTLFSCLVPMKLRNLLVNGSTLSAKYARVTISAFLCFGAGILMGVVLLHILIEVREGFQEALGYKPNIRELNLPFAELTLCVGLLFLFLMEEITHFSCGLQFQIKEKIESSPERSENGSFASLYSISNVDEREPGIQRSMSESSRKLNHRIIASSVRKRKFELTVIRSTLLIFTLSIQSTFEGLYLGLEESIDSVWLLCAAFSSHKVFIGFSIGMELMEIGAGKLLLLSTIFIFSFSSPVGILLGMTLISSIEEENNCGKLILRFLQGISGGAILFVTFCELFERERATPRRRFLRLASLFCGFLVMAILTGLTNHDLHNPDLSSEIHKNTQK